MFSCLDLKKVDTIDDFFPRYLDILLGLCLLLSLVSLEYGSMTKKIAPLAIFLVLSLGTLVVYLLWSLLDDSAMEVKST